MTGMMDQRHILIDRRPSTARDIEIEIVHSEEKLHVLGRLEQARQNKNLLYRHDKPNELTKRTPFICSL
jgi:hypothetical protein